MKLKIYDSKGAATAQSVTLADEVFGIEPNNHAIYLDVKQHLANKRQGTHKSKERNEIAGSTKKLKRQKGTGGARAGSAKSGTRVGGGRIFGPRPRNYHFKLNVKLKRLARKSAFAFKAKSDSLMVIQDLNMEAKTKDFKALLSTLNLENQKVLFILGDKTDSVYLASRNLGRVKVVTADSFNTYDVLNASKVILAESSIEKIQTILN
ncbi:MAG: 50S ribosomal protein L4 [Crocinitomicaceae bacterium]|jgi:large subunit ribosomal protein L4|nr:50S ribosomal protein L4 [Crocinitomicaceae bacterium]TAF90344.1 MAG: 50S ribosomal protein L4 [Flavobacteriia bacterium]MDP4596198.1 50S ribosomal protein L4 [Crocinitomicaceae bacterium]MDP4723953.1 50S ribosomal protein L4 [Crocinitomicaceae bacterium]MDP4798575.1 50S ribosomal protein L4 [Crocinitomicaceae bacterium]